MLKYYVIKNVACVESQLVVHNSSNTRTTVDDFNAHSPTPHGNVFAHYVSPVVRSTSSMLKYYVIKYVACVESQLVVHVRIMFTYLDHHETCGKLQLTRQKRAQRLMTLIPILRHPTAMSLPTTYHH